MDNEMPTLGPLSAGTHFRAGFGFGDIAKAAKGAPWADIVHGAASAAPFVPGLGLAAPLLNVADKSLQGPGIAWNLILDDGLINLWMSYQTSAQSVPTFPLPPDWTADKAKSNAAGVQAELTKRNLLDKANDKVKAFLAPPVPLQPPAVAMPAVAATPAIATPVAAPTTATPVAAPTTPPATATPVAADPPKTALAAGTATIVMGGPNFYEQMIQEHGKWESYPDAMILSLGFTKGPFNIFAPCALGVLYADIKPQLDKICGKLGLPAGTPIEKVAHDLLVDTMTKDLAAMYTAYAPLLRVVTATDIAGWKNVTTEQPLGNRLIDSRAIDAIEED